MNYRTRKFLSALVLAIGLPLYIVVASSVVTLFDRPPIWGELLIYVGLGIAWALPLRRLFLGIGRPDPKAHPPTVPPTVPPAGPGADESTGSGDH